MKKVFAGTCLVCWGIAGGFGAAQEGAPPFDVIVDIVNPDFDPDNYETRRSRKNVSTMPHRAEKLIGWVKIDFSRSNRIFPQKFTLYWDYTDDMGKKEILAGGDLKTKPDEHLVFTTDGDKPISYYHVNKRIWTDKTGTYDFRITYRSGGTEYTEKQTVTVNGG